MTNTKSFQVVESGLIVPGMPFSRNVRLFKRESAAQAYAARYRATRGPVRGTACAALCDAWTVSVVSVDA